MGKIASGSNLAKHDNDQIYECGNPMNIGLFKETYFRGIGLFFPGFAQHGSFSLLP